MIWRGEQRPGEARIGGYSADGRLLEIHLHREDGGPEPGAVLAGRVRRAGLQATLDWGGAPVALDRAERCPEGTLVAAEVVRAAIPEPGRLRPARARLLDVHPASAGLLEAAPPLDTHFPGLTWVSALDDLAEALETADGGDIPCGDFALSLERTRGGLVIDVDGGSDAYKTNLLAATEIARLLRLYQVGGSVLVDFRAMTSRTHRQAVTQAMLDASRDDPRPAEQTAVNGYGLLQLVRARPRPSVLDIRCGIQRCDADAATLALELLAQAKCSQGAGCRTIRAKPQIAQWLESRRALQDGVARTLGTELRVVADATVSGYGHVHVEHP